MRGCETRGSLGKKYRERLVTSPVLEHREYPAKVPYLDVPGS